MSDTIKKRDFHFEDVEKYKGYKISNENIRNVLKIFFPEGKIKIITKCVKDIKKIEKINNEDKKKQEIEKLKDKYQFLSYIFSYNIKKYNNEKSILDLIFEYYLNLNVFEINNILNFINWLDCTNNYIKDKKENKKYFSYNKELFNLLYDLYKLYINNKETWKSDVFLLNFVKIAGALKFKEIFSERERSTIVTNILIDLNDEINKNNLEKNRRSYFEAYKNIIEYDKENIEEYKYYIGSTIRILNIKELVEFKKFIEKIDCSFRLEIIEQYCSFLLNKYESDENCLKIIEENLEDILHYIKYKEDKIKLLEILSELVENKYKTNGSVDQITLFNNLLSEKISTNIEEYKKGLYFLYFENFESKKSTNDTDIKNLKEIINYLEFSTIEEFINYIKKEEVNYNTNVEKIKECLYSAYFEKLNNKQIIENEFSELKPDDYEKLIYYIKKMKEKKYDNKKIENFIEKYIAKNMSIYSNVLTHLEKEIINNKQEENFSRILTDNIDTILKIMKYQKSNQDSVQTIKNIIEDEEINKNENVLNKIYEILSSNIKEEKENKNKNKKFLKASTSVLQIEVNINNKKCTLDKAFNPKKSISDYFKNLFNDKKDENYENPKKLPARSETVNIGETKKQDINNNKIAQSKTEIISKKTEQNNTITQDTGIKKGKSFFSSLSIFSKDKNTNNNEQSSQLKRTNTPIID